MSNSLKNDEKAGSFFAKDTDPLWYSALMGTISGVTCVVVGHPLDTVKVRIQTGAKGPLFKHLFKGIVPPLLAVTPSWIGVFMAYGISLKYVGSNDLNSVALAGGMSGVAYSLIMCPFELVKVNAQKSQISTLQAFKNVWSANPNVMGMYRGFHACIGRDVAQSAVYYYCAESLNRSSFMKQTFGDFTPFAAGAITGVAHVSAEFPFDTVKSRYQTNAMLLSYRQCLNELFQPKVFTKASRALLPALIRAVFAHSTSFFAVQQLKFYYLDDIMDNMHSR
jgi:solute carrier family 25 (mitochondrial carnitine/acylcarnitine transporter), member 20/29